MDKELIGKLKGEQPLSAEEALRLDSALESERGQMVASIVSGLVDESPSLAWRSSLNERLAKSARKSRAALAWRFGFGATAAAATFVLAVILMQPTSVPDRAAPEPRNTVDNTPKESVEDAILAGHQDVVQQASLGVSVAYNDSGS
jgi:hypothetical protein